MVVQEHVCINEEKIKEHSLQLKSLESDADFKDKRMDELYRKIDKIEEKLDVLNNNINNFLLRNSQENKKMEIRLTKIETDIQNQKLESQRRIARMGIALTAITILINIYFKIIH